MAEQEAWVKLDDWHRKPFKRFTLQREAQPCWPLERKPVLYQTNGWQETAEARLEDRWYSTVDAKGAQGKASGSKQRYRIHEMEGVMFAASPGIGGRDCHGFARFDPPPGQSCFTNKQWNPDVDWLHYM